VVRKFFILFIYPSSLSAASLTLGTAVVATRSSTRVSTGEYLELGVSVGMLRKFQAKKKKKLFGIGRNHRMCGKYSGNTRPVIVGSPLGGPCKHYIQALYKNQELFNELNFMYVGTSRKRTINTCVTFKACNCTLIGVHHAVYCTRIVHAPLQFLSNLIKVMVTLELTTHTTVLIYLPI